MKSIPQHIKSVIEKIYNFPKTRQQKDIISSESFSKEVSRRLLADSVSSNLLLQPLQPVFFEVFHVGNIKNFGPIFIVMEYYQQADGTFSDLKKIEFADGITFLFQLFKDQFTFMNKKKFYHSDIHQNNICYFDVDSHFFALEKTYVIEQSKIFRYIDFGDTDANSRSEEKKSAPFLYQYEKAINKLLKKLKEIIITKSTEEKELINRVIKFEKEERENTKKQFQERGKYEKNKYLEEYFIHVSIAILKELKNNYKHFSTDIQQFVSKIPDFSYHYIDKVHNIEVEIAEIKTKNKIFEEKIDEKDKKIDEKDKWIKEISDEKDKKIDEKDKWIKEISAEKDKWIKKVEEKNKIIAELTLKIRKYASKDSENSEL